MKKHYLSVLSICAAMMMAQHALAIDAPKVPTQTPVNGGEYVLMNYARPDGYWSRTSWDGAYYLRDAANATYTQSTFTAISNGLDSWTFSLDTQNQDEEGNEIFNYVGIPFNACNLNGIMTDPVEWTLTEGDYAGFYHFVSSNGNNTETVGRMLHLNGSGEYAVISYPSNQWYPDFMGGVEKTEDGYAIYDENGECKVLDTSSTNWAFVNVSDLAVYIIKMNLYGAITKATEEAEDPDYAQGLNTAIAAATKVYEQETVTEEESATAVKFIDAMKSLIADIDNAAIINMDGNAELEQAIANAKTQYNEVKTFDDIEPIRTALNKAVNDYQMSTGDLTFMGTNMSFEDLSSQGGNAVSNVADAPVGWNIYLNGKLCTTAAEIQGGGVANWCGVNGDATGAIEGKYAFGMWTGGFPTTEVSQTISGLTNGTYTVTCALMAGANGNGSRLTTQRVFGNLNSTYYADQYSYAESLLDQNEVYGFAGLQDFATDTELQDISVKAYVYDGTLTFGFRTDGNFKAANRENGNGSGGDGWFKIDNFRITSNGYSTDDALAVVDHFVKAGQNILDEGSAMQTSVQEAAEKTLEECEMTSSNTEEEINAAIFKAKDAYNEMNASVKAYTKLAKAIEEASTNLNEYSNYAGADDYSDAIQTAVDDFEEAIVNEEEIEKIIQQLDEAFEACKLSGVAVGIYVTDLIKNPSFEDMSNQGNITSGGVANVPVGWELTLNSEPCYTASDIAANGVSAWAAINNGDAINVTDDEGDVHTQQPTDQNCLWGIWNNTIPEVALSQTLTNLPAGTYTMTADVMVEYNWAGCNLTTQRIFANGHIQMFGSPEDYENNLPADAAEAAQLDELVPGNNYLTYANYTCTSGDETTSLLKTMKVTFGVDESGIATIGFRTNGINAEGKTASDGGVSGQGWFKIDNFTLFYESDEIPTAITTVQGEATGNVQATQNYTIGGARTAKAVKGINIQLKKMADGQLKAVKVLKK